MMLLQSRIECLVVAAGLLAVTCTTNGSGSDDGANPLKGSGGSGGANADAAPGDAARDAPVEDAPVEDAPVESSIDPATLACLTSKNPADSCVCKVYGCFKIVGFDQWCEPGEAAIFCWKVPPDPTLPKSCNQAHGIEGEMCKGYGGQLLCCPTQ